MRHVDHTQNLKMNTTPTEKTEVTTHETKHTHWMKRPFLVHSTDTSILGAASLVVGTTTPAAFLQCFLAGGSGGNGSRSVVAHVNIEGHSCRSVVVAFLFDSRRALLSLSSQTIHLNTAGKYSSRPTLPAPTPPNYSSRPFPRESQVLKTGSLVSRTESRRNFQIPKQLIRASVLRLPLRSWCGAM
jgi:hypothetical protein